MRPGLGLPSADVAELEAARSALDRLETMNDRVVPALRSGFAGRRREQVLV
jgi:hypothetical protein